MKHLSLLTALMLSSSMVYAEWITEDYKGDCLEMMCDCVEKDGIGHCCPSGTSFNGKGDAHIEYTPCKCLGANTYYNTTSQKCLSKPTCNPCQKLNVATGTCVADTSKNNQAVGACGKCNNGSVITDTTKETVCKTCNTTNWTLTNRANGQAVGTCGKCNNGSVVTDTTKVTPCKTCDTTNWTLTNRANETQVQDVCHICKNGNVVLKDSTKQFISNNTCVECLADYGTGKSGACTTEAKPLCQNNVCQACPAESPYWKNGACHSAKYEKKLPKSVSFSVHNGGDKHTSCKSKHKVYVYVEALSTNKGTFNGTLSLVETDSDNHRKYLKLNGQRFSKDTQYNYDVSLKPGAKELVATYSDSDNFAKSSSRGKITITKADLSGKFSGGTGEVKVQIKHSPSCSLSWVSDNENGFGPNGGTYSY